MNTQVYTLEELIEIEELEQELFERYLEYLSNNYQGGSYEYNY